MKLILRFTFLFLLFFISRTVIFSQELSAILPKNGSFVNKQAVKLTWNEHHLATNYIVQMAQNESFTIGFQQSPLTVTTHWQTPVLAFGKWYWRIVASVGMQNVYSNVYQFRVFQPNNLPGNTLWLAADTNLVATGSSVVSWNDLSGNGNHFSQATSTDQPLKVNSVSVLNDQPVVRFDGVSDFLSAGNVLNIGTNSLSTFILAKGTGVFYSKFGNSVSPFNIHSCYNIGSEGGFEMAGSVYQAYLSSFTSNYHTLNFIGNRATSNGKLFRNFSQIISNPISGISSPSYNFITSNPLLMGRYSMTGSPFFLNGDIAEIIFFNVALSDSSRLLIQNYLNDKYAPPVNLGKDSIITASFCPINLSAPVGFTNLLWSTGETTSSINLSQSGLYWLSAKNIFGVTSIDTIHITFPVIASPPTTEICANSNIVWNSGFTSPNTFLWSNGATTPSLTIANPGVYWVKVTDGNGCFLTSDTLTFSLDNFEFDASLGNDTTLCSGNTISLQEGANSAISYLWQDGSTTPALSVNATGTYSLHSVNVNGCISEDTINVIVSGNAPVAMFGFQNGCNNLAHSFLDESTGTSGDIVASWHWDFGDGQTSTTQNPSHLFNSSGSYLVELSILSLGNCGATFVDTILIFQAPIANFTSSNLCTESEAIFSDLSIFSGASPANFSWSFDEPLLGPENFSTLQFPSIIYPEVGNFSVNLSVEDQNGCVDDTTILVGIMQSPTAKFLAQKACLNELVSIVNQSIVENPASYHWEFGNGISSSFQNPIISYQQIGFQDITLLVTSPNGCQDVADTSLLISPFPQPYIQLGPICAGTFLSLTDTSKISMGTIDNVTWIFNATDTLVGESVQFLVPNLNQQQVSVLVESDAGCVSNLSQFFTASSILNASFTTNLSSIASGVPLEITNNSIGATAHNWSFGDGNYSTDIAPVHSYSENYVDSQLTLSLVVSNSVGCSDTFSKTLTVIERLDDLLLKKLYVQENGNFAILGVELENKGTSPIEEVNLKLLTEEGFLFQEKWTGSLLPGASVIYVFGSQPKYVIDAKSELNSFYCVQGELDGDETDYSNNEACLNLENELNLLLPIFPNPAKENITFQILTSKISKVSLRLIDERGKVITEFLIESELKPAIHTFDYSIQMVESGVYFLEMSDESQKVVQRISIVH